MTHIIREKVSTYTCTDRRTDDEEKFIVRIVEEYMDEYAGSNATEEERNQIIYEVTVSYEETDENIPHMGEGILEDWDAVEHHIKGVFKKLNKDYRINTTTKGWERGCYCEMCVARLGAKK